MKFLKEKHAQPKAEFISGVRHEGFKAELELGQFQVFLLLRGRILRGRAGFSPDFVAPFFPDNLVKVLLPSLLFRHSQVVNQLVGGCCRFLISSSPFRRSYLADHFSPEPVAQSILVQRGYGEGSPRQVSMKDGGHLESLSQRAYETRQHFINSVDMLSRTV
ncbi:hypothetical protein KSP40_PGU003635 [Platanthera guangdongensis]|uniref:Maturase K n=1 Tax=Platanthera guangdongensis TaxID=2320717 RepID=A0ABR2MUY6_9ASPA